MFKLRDHWKPILFFIFALVFITVFLAIVKIQIEKNPEIISETRDFAKSYGLLGGFLTAFIGSQWFLPFPYELIVVPIMKLYKPTIIALLFIAVRSTVADIVNFYTGRKLGEKYILKRIEKKTAERIQNFLTKYGVATLVIFSFIGPVTSYDIVSFAVGGFSKMEFKTFLPVTFACRVIHFTVALLLADFLLRAAGIAL
ncbi:TPA: VTT domain-containing protein [archaeon]|uniref:VTT domain-containing protein n=1 Tax=Candidatus Naiadarchaeum limnaeum TaxID=2756139 RepID=A0A832XI67_9ARCH|nr:VTT domain-containing protein [Candidatus Naiadarchaeum limnaeum]